MTGWSLTTKNYLIQNVSTAKNWDILVDIRVFPSAIHLIPFFIHKFSFYLLTFFNCLYVFILPGNTSFLDQKINKQSILVPVLQAPFSHRVTNDVPARAPQEMHLQSYESWSLCRVTYTSVHPLLRRCRETFVLECK